MSALRLNNLDSRVSFAPLYRHCHRCDCHVQQSEYVQCNDHFVNMILSCYIKSLLNVLLVTFLVSLGHKSEYLSGPQLLKISWRLILDNITKKKKVSLFWCLFQFFEILNICDQVSRETMFQTFVFFFFKSQLIFVCTACNILFLAMQKNVIAKLADIIPTSPCFAPTTDSLNLLEILF